MKKNRIITNLVQLTDRNRYTPVAGDLFCVNVMGLRWIAGRVIHLESRFMGGGGGEVLVYMYSLELAEPSEASVPLHPHLLVGPMVTNLQGWRCGYFVTLGSYPLEKDERLPIHYFAKPTLTAKPWGSTEAGYCDEYGRDLPPPPPGTKQGYGLVSYAALDDWVSRALGLPLAPFSPGEKVPFWADPSEHATEPPQCECTPEMQEQIHKAIAKHTALGHGPAGSPPQVKLRT
jgi:hypothetical protein